MLLKAQFICDLSSCLLSTCFAHVNIEPVETFFTFLALKNVFILFPEYKRSRHEIKKKSSDTMKLQKKARKGNTRPTDGRRRQMFLLYVIFS